MRKFHVYFNNNRYVTCVYARDIYRARFVAYDTHPVINQFPYSITQIVEMK